MRVIHLVNLTLLSSHCSLAVIKWSASLLCCFSCIAAGFHHPHQEHNSELSLTRCCCCRPLLLTGILVAVDDSPNDGSISPTSSSPITTALDVKPPSGLAAAVNTLSVVCESEAVWGCLVRWAQHHGMLAVVDGSRYRSTKAVWGMIAVM